MFRWRNLHRLVSAVVGIALILLTVGLLFNQIGQKRAIEETARQQGDAVTALAFHTERELLRLQRELAVGLARPEGLDRERLRLRYDIFRQGTAWLRDSPSMHILASQPKYTELLPRLNALLQTADGVLARAQPDVGELQALLGQLDALQKDLMALSAAASQVESQQFETLLARLLDQSDLVLGLLVLQIVLLALAAAALVLRQQRQRAARRAMEQINAELQQERLKADAANQAKSQFLANMTHELRTPFNGILGMIRILQATGLSAQQQEYTDMMGRAANALLALINDILDFSRVESGKVQINRQPFYLDRLLRDVSDILSADTNSERVDVLFNVDPGLERALWGDPMKLQQVLINLGSNAIKFTNQGYVEIAVRRRAGQPDARSASQWLEFSVQDTGIGIAPEHQAQIFAGFSQAEATPARKYGGTGLGLAISQRLVELMGARLQLRSTLGQGSEFYFALDLPEVTDMSVDALPSPGLDLQECRRILVVDDSEHSRACLARITRSWNWPTDLADSGPAALQRLRAALDAGEPPYQVIVVDWHMPGMDGWAFAQQLRRLPLGDTPAPNIVMISGTRRERLAQQSIQDHALINAFLVRPFTAAQLHEVALRPQGTQTFLRQGARARPAHGRLAGMRILVVEDNPLNQKVAQELLKMEGARITIAANGKLGVEAALAPGADFDLVLMDLQMPVMDGFEATRIIRQSRDAQQLPIIAMTANTLPGDRLACLQAGMNEHIGKPFDMGKLVSLLIRTVGAPAAVAQPQPQPGPAAPEAAEADLPHIAGLDLQAAVQRLAGARGLYLHAARDFHASLAALLPQLQRLCAEGDAAGLRQALHTLKGNAATLGAMALAHEAGVLERLSAAGVTAQLATDLLALQPVLDATRDSLQQAMDQLVDDAPLEAAPALPGDQAAALAVLDRLLSRLRANDLEAMVVFEQNRSLLRACYGPQCDPLEAALQELDLPRAVELCSQLRSAAAPAPV